MLYYTPGVNGLSRVRAAIMYPASRVFCALIITITLVVVQPELRAWTIEQAIPSMLTYISHHISLF